MLIIRDQQMRVLSLALFERWVVEHLREHFAGPCGELGDAGLRSLVERGLQAARRYGFVQEADLCGYLDLTVALGADFDADPRFPWASAILKNPAFKSPGRRMEALSEAACDHLRRLEHPEEFATAGEAEPPEPEEEEEDQEEDEFQEDLVPDAAEEEPEVEEEDEDEAGDGEAT